MAFHDVRFPTDISYGSSGGPGWKTNILELSSGAEQRVSRWSSPRRKYDVSYGVRSYSQLSNLYEFYLARQGAANSFRYKDWFDYTSANPGTVAPSATDQDLGTTYSSGTVTAQLRKKYQSGTNIHYRTITKPVENSVLVSINNVALSSGFTVNLTTGVVTITNGGGNTGAIKAGFEFDTPVRFSDTADEGISLRMDDFTNASTSVELIEVIGEDIANAGAMYNYGGANALGTLSADASLTLGGGRVVTFASDANTRKIKLPSTSGLALGGPYFYLVNTSGSYKALIYESNGTTSVGEVAAEGEKTVVLGKNSGGTTTWYLVP